MENKTKASIYTMIISLLNSIAIIIFNLIYNNYLIRVYGSEVNGLISTLTQFVSMFFIIEGGFTTAAIVATYDPIVGKNYKKLNDILYTTKKTYLRIGALITIFVLIFGSVYIPLISSPFSCFQTYSLLIISALTTASSLCFLSKYSVLLSGSNREYVQIIISLVAKTITWIISMFLIIADVNIILVYQMNFFNILLNIVFASQYEKKKYPYVNYKGIYDAKLISGTKDVLLQRIANTIFTSTDLILISAFISLSSASVYNLYYQIFRSILTLLSSIVQAPFNSFGQLVQTDDGKQKLDAYFSIYQHLVLIISNIFLTCTGALILPFVKVYTIQVLDYNYIYPSLALLFFSQIFAQIINRPFGTILNATGNFKMQNKQCIVAAVVNIIVSLAFIKYWGMNSVILGSFVATLVMVVVNIIQVYRNILKSGLIKSIKNIIVNYIVGIFIICVQLKLDVTPVNYVQWILLGGCVFFTISPILILLNYILDRESMISVVKYIKSKINCKRLTK